MVEFALIILSGALIYRIYPAPSIGYEKIYFIIVPAVAILSLPMFKILHTYHLAAFRRPPMRQVFRLMIGWTFVFSVLFATIFFLRLNDMVSRGWVLLWFFSGILILAIERAALFLITKSLIRSGRLTRRTVVVGCGELGYDLLNQLKDNRCEEVRVLGIFDDRGSDRAPGEVEGYQKLGTVDDLVCFARRTRVDLIIIALPIPASDRILEIIRKLCVLPSDIRIAAQANRPYFKPDSYIGEIPLFDVLDTPITGWGLVVKLAFDKIVGALILIVISPILLAIALAVKLDSPGPVFFRQKRYGFNNELIEVFKFRSMYTDKSDEKADKLVTRDDSRVTRVGRFIRKTSLDELPQLFNVVFKGNLSLVGPRPHAVHAKAGGSLYDEVVDLYFARHRVLPGITGWAQINGWRGETDVEEKIHNRVEHDLYYIENWSFLLDLRILIFTPFALLKAKHVY